MTQPVDGFTTADLCSGRWPTPSDYRRAMWEELRKPKPEKPEPLPRREPGKYTHDKIWQVRV